MTQQDYVGRYIIDTNVTAIFAATPDLCCRTINPVKPLLTDIPYRTFTKVVLAVDNQSNLGQRHLPSPVLQPALAMLC